MSAGNLTQMPVVSGSSPVSTRRERYARLRPLPARNSSPAMDTQKRLIAAGYVIGLLVLALLGQLLSLTDLRAVALTLFLLTASGIAPCLLVRQLSVSAFVLSSGALSISFLTLVGYAMARGHAWHPTVVLLFLIVVSVILLGISVPADVSARSEVTRSRKSRGDVRSGSGLVSVALTAVGAVLIAVDSYRERQDPTPGGLLSQVGYLWYLGVVAVLAAAMIAWLSNSSPAAPLLVLATAVIASQALMYGAPAVMSAGKHVGLVEFIRADGLSGNTTDIYQAWPGLFAMGGVTVDAAHIGDPMTLATWFPVGLSVYTALAIRLLAGRFLRTAPQAWAAAAVATLGGSVNIIYFSPQSVGFALCLVTVAMMIGDRSDEAPSRTWLRWGLVALLTCAVTITHQISPYLMVAEVVCLVLFRLIRPWWLPLALLVPPIAWAVLHRSALSGFVSIDALGHIFENLAPPVHGGASLPEAAATRWVFDLPAVVMVIVGLLGLLAVIRRHDRLTFGLAAAAASSGSLFGVTNYGSEGVFRVVLFALPWLAILAVMAFDDVRTARVAPRIAVGAALVALFAVNAYGQTGLDWARVVRPDTVTALRQFEETAPAKSAVLVVGTGNAVPSRVTARYADVQYVSRETLNNYPDVTSGYDPAKDVAQLTAALKRDVRGVPLYALVSDSTGAWDDRYGLQSYADYLRLEQAMAASPSWKLVYSGPTTKLYQATTS